MGLIFLGDKLDKFSRKRANCKKLLMILQVNHFSNVLIYASKNGLIQTLKDFESKEENLQP